MPQWGAIGLNAMRRGSKPLVLPLLKCANGCVCYVYSKDCFSDVFWLLLRVNPRDARRFAATCRGGGAFTASHVAELNPFGSLKLPTRQAKRRTSCRSRRGTNPTMRRVAAQPTCGKNNPYAVALIARFIFFCQTVRKDQTHKAFH